MSISKNCKDKSKNSNVGFSSIDKKSVWFDGDCLHAKTLYLNDVDAYVRYKSEDNRLKMQNSKRVYKNLVKRKRKY